MSLLDPTLAAGLDEALAAAGPRDVAVVGMAGRFPGARDLAQFWQNLKGGVEAVTFLSDEELRADLGAVDLTLLSHDQAEAVLDFQNELDVGTERPALEMIARETLETVAVGD